MNHHLPNPFSDNSTLDSVLYDENTCFVLMTDFQSGEGAGVDSDNNPGSAQWRGNRRMVWLSSRVHFLGRPFNPTKHVRHGPRPL
jgi:hypothetical protein